MTAPIPHSRNRTRSEFEREVLGMRAALRRSADALIEERGALWATLDLRRPSRRAGVDVPPSRSEAIAVDTDEVDGDPRCAILNRLLGRIHLGETVSRRALDELVSDLIDQISRGRERVVSAAIGSSERGAPDSLERRCLATVAISVVIAAELGLSRVDVHNAGLAGLVSDFGMTLLPRGLMNVPRPLSEIERNSVMRHPAYTVAILSRIDGLPAEVALAAYQHHEREYGSGYPGRKRGVQIHDLAKVVAVADVFTGAAGSRAYRPRPTAHAALAQVVRLAAEGALDRGAAAALLRACGMYPPGSVVRLNTGDVGVVLVTRPAERVDRPVVRVRGGAGHDWTVDLGEYDERDLAVAGVLDLPVLGYAAAAS